MTIASASRAAVTRRANPEIPVSGYTFSAGNDGNGNGAGPSDPHKPNAIESLAQQIPTEAVAAYSVGLAFIVDESVGVRWAWAIFIVLAAIVYSLGTSRREARRQGVEPTIEWAQLALVTFAAAVYVCVIPGSALSSAEWFTPALAGLVGVVGNLVIGAAALWMRE